MSSVFTIISICQNAVTAEKLVAFHGVPIESHPVKFRNGIGQFIELSLICLLTDSLREGAAVTARHGGSLTHRVLHGKLAVFDVIIFHLLIEGVLVDVVGKILSPRDLLHHIFDLFVPLRLIFLLRIGRIFAERGLGFAVFVFQTKPLGCACERCCVRNGNIRCLVVEGNVRRLNRRKSESIPHCRINNARFVKLVHVLQVLRPIFRVRVEHVVGLIKPCAVKIQIFFPLDNVLTGASKLQRWRFI